MRRRRWSEANGAVREHAGPRGGTLRRRRALRSLDSLAQEAARELSPRSAVTHVRLLGGAHSTPRVRHPVGHAHEEVPGAAAGMAAGDPSAGPPRSPGFSVRAVPIDQPFGDRPET